MQRALTKQKDRASRACRSLKKEVLVLSSTNKEDAETVANFTKTSTHEAIKTEKNKAYLIFP